MESKYLIITIILGAISLFILSFILFWSIRFNKNKLKLKGNKFVTYYAPLVNRKNLRFILIVFSLFIPVILVFQFATWSDPDRRVLFIFIDLFFITFVSFIIVATSGKWKIYAISKEGIHFFIHHLSLTIPFNEIKSITEISGKDAEEMICIKRYNCSNGSVMLIGVKKNYKNPLEWYLSVLPVQIKTKDKVVRISLSADVLLVESIQGYSYLISPIDKLAFLSEFKKLGN